MANGPAGEASLQTTLGRSRRCSIPSRAPLHRPIRFLRRPHHGLLHVDVVSSADGPRGRGERDALNDRHAFDAPARFSLSERASPGTGTSLLLHGPLPLDTYRHRRDVAAVSISSRDGNLEMKTNRS
jgi:hypothetical protein